MKQQYEHLDYVKKIQGRNGYVYLKLGNYWVQEHRYVVEQFIGRKLRPEERVHHLNEIKTDNRIENLMLFDSQKEHQAFHNKIKQFGYTNPIKRQIRDRWKKYGIF